jgi:glycosyltransferase involved in cell wall biosynthesis
MEMKNDLSSETVGCKACEDLKPQHTASYVRISNTSVTKQTAAYDDKFSAIIPLYNKETEVARAIRSVLAQTLPPTEIVIVDDGSTDGSAAVVENIIAERDTDEGAKTPPIRLIRQPNTGETAARNRGMAEAVGTHFALLDADDEWRPEFLQTIAALISDFPDAGLYCTGFDVARGGTITPGRTPAQRGVVDYFDEAMTQFVATASSSVVPRRVVEKVGGFPDGMRLGGDQYMWAKIALACPVAFTPERAAVIHAEASNRSAATYTPEVTSYSFLDLYDPDNPALSEYIARVALGKAITATVRGGTEEGRRAERDFSYNHRSRRLWWRLRLLNRLPRAWRPILNGAYNRLAWIFLKKGF